MFQDTDCLKCIQTVLATKTEGLTALWVLQLVTSVSSGDIIDMWWHSKHVFVQLCYLCFVLEYLELYILSINNDCLLTNSLI